MTGYSRVWSSLSLIIMVSLWVGLAGCGPDEVEPPPQDHFRLLKVALNRVQNATAERNRLAIDSLLVPGLRDEPEGADSLLRFVYGADPDFQFEAFANYQIFHTHDMARIDLEIAGSDSLPGRPATFTFKLIDSLWYLKRWESGLPAIGTDPAESE